MSSQPQLLYRPALARQDSDAVGAALNQMAYAFLWLFAFATPWSEANSGVDGFLMNRLCAMAAFGLTFLSSAVVGRRRKLCELHYWMLAFALWSAASVLWSSDVATTVTRAGTYLQLLLLAWVVWELAASELRVLNLLHAYVFGTCVCAIGTIASELSGQTMDMSAEGYNSTSDRYTFNGLNPNDVGIMLGLSVPIVLYLAARRKGGTVGALVCWVQLVLVVTGILLTGSRGGAFTAAVGLLILPFALVRLPAWQKTVAAAACAGVIAAGIFLVPSYTWQRFTEAGDEISRGTMTHRTQIWAASEVVFREHPLVGVGSGAHPVAVAGILGRSLVAHNTFISVLVELGVIGELLFLGMLGSCCYAIRRMAGLERAFWFVIVAAWATGVCSGTWEYRKPTWFLLSLLAAHAYLQKPWQPPARVSRRGFAGVSALVRG
jgi:O-antigen ligase